MKIMLILLLLAALTGCYSKDPVKTAHKGQKLPQFDIFLADSCDYFNTKNLPNGTAIVLFFFGPHCPFSRAQMQGIVDNMDKFKNVQFVVLTTAPFNEMKEFYTKFKLVNYPNIKVGVDYKNFFPSYFETRSVPYLAIYGSNRQLNEAFEGQTPIGEIKQITEE